MAARNPGCLEARKERLSKMPQSLNFPGRVIFRSDFLSLLTVPNRIPHTDVFSISPNPGRCVEENRSTGQVARQKHGPFFLVTQRACPQATLSETAKEVVKKRRRSCSECCVCMSNLRSYYGDFRRRISIGDLRIHYVFKIFKRAGV